jgi:multicomponent Na+:H+ antiporter subunit E
MRTQDAVGGDWWLHARSGLPAEATMSEMGETQVVQPTVAVGTRPEDNLQILILLAVNIGLGLVWLIFLPVWGVADYFIGFLVGALALAVYERAYGWRIWWFVTFLLFVVWEILVSNLKLAWLILQPRPWINAGIVGVPLTLDNDIEIIVLASVLTLTPGTLSLELGRDEHGQRILYVHSIVVDDPEAFRREIKATFEQRLALVTRGRSL